MEQASNRSYNVGTAAEAIEPYFILFPIEEATFAVYLLYLLETFTAKCSLENAIDQEDVFTCGDTSEIFDILAIPEGCLMLGKMIRYKC